MAGWHVYIVRASDDSLYTGITTDIDHRVTMHNSGKGAKSLRGKLPVSLVYAESCLDRVSAMRREKEIQSWRREEKVRLIQSFVVS